MLASWRKPRCDMLGDKMIYDIIINSLMLLAITVVFVPPALMVGFAFILAVSGRTISALGLVVGAFFYVGALLTLAEKYLK